MEFEVERMLSGVHEEGEARLRQEEGRKTKFYSNFRPDHPGFHEENGDRNREGNWKMDAEMNRRYAHGPRGQ
ncbi:hypothetical protein UFOVP23_1 [uncultured Caudovirales phage]|uniref:Uncharacterized protein n=1 Tax=uncultured Caudovirales phage TaxID=2100421 RepID=A0A6J5T7J1_9CAUD|nr:hypothetical protein UFOVP23_1 [uncultured Caudovirales phage]